MTAVVKFEALSQGIGYTRRADEALAGGWRPLQASIGTMTLNLSRATGREWVALVSPLEGMDRFNRSAQLVALWFCSDDVSVEDRVLSEAATPLRGGWTLEGVQALEQGHPVPVVASFGDAVHGVQLRVADDEPAQIFSLELDTAGEIACARHMSRDVEAADAVVDIEVETGEPTTAHLITLIIYTAMVSMVKAGLDEAAAKRCFEQNTSAVLVDDLGIATGEHTDLCNALVPCLKTPTSFLDEDDCRVIAKMCVMLLMADGEPPAEAVVIARQVAGSVGVELP